MQKWCHHLSAAPKNDSIISYLNEIYGDIFFIHIQAPCKTIKKILKLHKKFNIQKKIMS